MGACIDTFGGLVWSIANKYARNKSDAEDLVQEIFTALWKGADRYDHTLSSEATFIGLLARRRSIDWLRRQGRCIESEPLTDDISEMSATFSHPGVSADRELVMLVLRRLPEETQQLFRFHFEQGMSHSEIARETGMPLGTVKTRMRTGLLDLRKFMKNLDGPKTSRLV